MACRAVRPRATRDEPSIQVAGATASREGGGQSGSRGRAEGERRTLIADPVRADIPARLCALRFGHRVEICRREERQNELAQEREGERTCVGPARRDVGVPPGLVLDRDGGVDLLEDVHGERCER